ncbi:fibronectin type III domain-containing protein [Cytobacillus horneckiae]|uniref:fibronectin type III domain-containing protein n=1 Tax=Cytobacillus horneckiae TaxID=549687 RepID=UPI0034CE79AC
MAKRPEGLSPYLRSIVSPQIEDSLIFSWTFIPSNSSDYQKAANVRIYNEGSNTALITLEAGVDESIDLSERLSSLTLEKMYEWEVRVTAADNSTASSGRKLFQYGLVDFKGDLEWPNGPDPYEYIGTRKYFNEIRENIISVLHDYVVDSAEEEKMMKEAQSLFTNYIVPSRTDFVTLENILHLISIKENSYKDEVDQLIEDGLGAQDIHKIYSFIDRLTKLPPAPPSNINLTFHDIQPLKIASGSAKNAGKADLTIDVKWEPSYLETAQSEIYFGNDLMEDISVYHIKLQVGFSDYSVSHSLFFRISDLNAWRRSIRFSMDHIVFHHLSSSKKTSYSIAATAIDRRGKESTTFNKTYNVANVPLGVKSYQLRAQQMDVADKSVVKAYYDIYNGTNKAYVHTVKGTAKGVYRYAVRVYDINGSVSAWLYLSDRILIDPLDPPAAPKPKVKSTTVSAITFEWPSVKTATSYEIQPPNGGSNVTTSSLNRTFSGLKEKTKYTMKIRARNAAGNSAWVSVSGTTKAKPIVTYTQNNIRSRTWRTSYEIKYQNGRITRPAAEYRTEMDNKEVLHGQWIELRDKVQDGLAVKKGTRWGNHKSLFFLDYNGWQSRLKGKEIVSVRFYIRRKSTSHGYSNDGRFLNVYSHNYTGTGALPAASKGPSIANHHKVDKLDWDRGQGHWVTLPKSYGERLRDGKIKGIAFHHPTSDKSPYSYMRFDANTFKFEVKYK